MFLTTQTHPEKTERGRGRRKGAKGSNSRLGRY